MSEFERDIDHLVDKMVRANPIRTQGMRDDMKEMLLIIKGAYDSCKEYTDDWTCDIRPSLWSKDTELQSEVYSLSYIADTVQERLKEIYAILVAGLGRENQSEE